MEPFELVTPTTVSQAHQALAQDNAIALGGGTATVMMMKQRLINPATVVWLGKIPELTEIQTAADGSIHVGATATLAQIVQSHDLQTAYPALARAAAGIGNPRVRAVATMGGNLLHADPCQDMPPLLLVLGAAMVLSNPQGKRTLPVTGDFFVDYMQTAIDEHDLLEHIVLPAPSPGCRATYLKFTPRSQDDFATVGVAAALQLDADGVVLSARVALAGVGATPIVVDQADDLLAGRRPAAADIAQVAEAAAAAAEPWDDQRGSEAYKRAMARVWTRRALEELLP